jgi:hypothetical protein
LVTRISGKIGLLQASRGAQTRSHALYTVQ